MGGITDFQPEHICEKDDGRGRLLGLGRLSNVDGIKRTNFLFGPGRRAAEDMACDAVITEAGSSGLFTLGGRRHS